MSTYTQVVYDLNSLANPVRARHSQRFFKTGPGEYGESDIFIGLTVPQQRLIAAKYINLPLSGIEKLLENQIHEYRLTALIILVHVFTKGDTLTRSSIYSFYLEHIKYINNWDLVDTSAHKIVGAYLLEHSQEQKVLQKLVVSNSLWERRIAVIATFAFIDINQFDLSLDIATKLLSDSEDLIHKAVGWMLREVGKKDIHRLRLFLDANVLNMPRTMLRYAIEKMDENTRKHYLSKV